MLKHLYHERLELEYHELLSMFTFNFNLRRCKEGLVFSRTELARLHARIDELVGEKAALRGQQRDLRKEHVQLQRNRKVGCRNSKPKGCLNPKP